MTEEEIRQDAIQRHILGGEPPKEICKSLNRSKQWLFKWLKRYKTGAADWYKEQSRTPKTSPSGISPEAKERIILTRQHLEASPYAQIGVSAIKWELKKLGLPFPSDRTINRVIKNEGLVKKNSLCSQGSRIPLFHRGPVLQQYPPDGSVGASLYQTRRQVLLDERYRSILP
jgi:transposase-like protein